MKFKINLSRQGNFLLSILLIYFVFFGYICNIYNINEGYKTIGSDLIFLYRVLFGSFSYFSSIILIIIVFLMAYREDYFQYALRNAIWLTPIIIGISWLWYWIIYGFNFFMIVNFFINLEGYITILSIFGINFGTALLASYLKIRYLDYIKKLDLIKSID